MRSFVRSYVCDTAQNMRSFFFFAYCRHLMGKGVHECVLDTRFISEMAMRLASVIFLTYVGKRALSRAKMQLMVLRPCRGM